MGIEKTEKFFPGMGPVGVGTLLFHEDDGMIEKKTERKERPAMRRPAWPAGRLEKLTILLTAAFAVLTLAWFLLPQGEASSLT